MGKRLLFFLALFVGLLPSQSLASVTIVMVFGGGYPPFYSYTLDDAGDTSQMQGAFIDFLAAFERDHPQYVIEKVHLPRLRMDQWLRDGRADAFSLNSPLFTPEEDKELVDFSLPIWTSSDHLIVLSSSSLESAELSGLKGKCIGLVYGNGYGPLDAFVSSGEIGEYRAYNGNQLSKMLLAGRVDGYVGNRHVEPVIWRGNDYDADLFRMLMPPLYEFDLSVVVRKNNKQFLRDMNAFIKKSRTNGFLESINRKHFHNVLNK